MIRTTWWPRSWNSRNLRRTTVWPRWMSGVVGSTPSLTRRVRPLPSWRSSCPCGRASTAFLSRKREASTAGSVINPMLDCRPRQAPVRRAVPARAVRRLTTLRRARASRRSAERGPVCRSCNMNEPPTSTLPRTPPVAPVEPGPQSGNGGPPHRVPRTRVKKLRLAFILFGLSCLAIVSTVFGMMMAVASDLPALESQAEYRKAKNSVLVAADGRTEVAKLTGNLNRILRTEDEISPMIKNAVIAVEDRRFYEHEGVDYKGIARALSQDLRRQKAVQGGSTITQHFVKNALSAQGNRSVFQKLREAALAYHMERRWSK